MTISVSCTNCEATLKLKDPSVIGKKVRCPKCQEPFLVEAPPGDDFTDDFEDFSEGDDEEQMEEEFSSRRGKKGKGKGKKKKSGAGSKILMYSLIGVLAIGLIVGMVFLVMNFMGGGGKNPNKIDLTWAPDDANIVFVIKPAEIWNAPFIQGFLNDPQYKAQIDMGMQQMQAQLGFGVTDIEEVVIAGKFDEQTLQGLANNPNPNPLMLMSLADKFTAVVKLKKAFDTTKFEGMRETTVNGKKIYNTQFVSLLLPTSSTLVAGTNQVLEGFAHKGQNFKRRPEFDFVDTSLSFYYAYTGYMVNPAQNPLLQAIPEMQAMQTVLDEVKPASAGGIRITSDIELVAVYDCKSSDGAAKLKGGIDPLFTKAKEMYTSQVKPMLAFTPAIDTLATDIVNQLAANVDGNTLTIKIKIPASIKDTIAQLAQMGQMFGGGGMNPFGAPPPNLAPPPQNPPPSQNPAPEGTIPQPPVPMNLRKTAA